MKCNSSFVGFLDDLLNSVIIVQVDVVEGEADYISVGCEVEYQSVRRGKRLEAVSVKLVKSVVYEQGVITHWVPEKLAGIINNGHTELVIHRKDFVRGGFVGDIIGKIVRYKLDESDGSIARHAEVLEIYDDVDDGEDLSPEDLDNVSFSPLDFVISPLVECAVDRNRDIFEMIEDMTEEEVQHQVKILQPLLVKLSAHPVGYKLVIALASVTRSSQVQEMLVRRVSHQFLVLSTSSAGAVCLLELMGITDMHQLFTSSYLSLSNPSLLTQHMTGHNSQLVFQSCLPLLTAPHLRSIITCLCSGVTQSLATLSCHQSMSSLITHAAQVDTQSLVILTNNLEIRSCLLEEEFYHLSHQLIKQGGRLQTAKCIECLIKCLLCF